MSSQLQAVSTLHGRENYRTWSIKMRTYLKYHELWNTIEPTPSTVNSTGIEIPGTLTTDPKNLDKAHSLIELACHETLLSTIEKKTSAKEAWETLKTAYEDDGYSRLVGLLIKLTTTKLEDCLSVEQYIDIIQKTNNQVTDLGVVMPDVAIGALMLAGLPERYSTLVMAIGGSNSTISSNVVKQKILQEVKIDFNETNYVNQAQGYMSSSKRVRGGRFRSNFTRPRGNQ